ncbi:4Fe-4S dicluster domain-containing protein [Methanosarcina sp. DH2]|jgi:predicted aldo/keto reductase-like oxidoreductase|uniref:4Fe-4S dicluster domain-containing protein n=1 Tax=Methanosarcina sp. DH2 TaxID=2605639 RepID=UPI001E5284F4|nr:4Fe-4S dicluster domain-containing protein [Methanosarcina sp. DH2]
MNEGSHIKENLKIADEAYPNSLTENEIQLIGKVKQKYCRYRKIGCTGCQYCMPCPSSVDIPSCFRIYNNLHMFGNVDGVNLNYVTWTSGIFSNIDPGFVSQCVQCGQCMEKCPQNLKNT